VSAGLPAGRLPPLQLPAWRLRHWLRPARNAVAAGESSAADCQGRLQLATFMPGLCHALLQLAQLRKLAAPQGQLAAQTGQLRCGLLLGLPLLPAQAALLQLLLQAVNQRAGMAQAIPVQLLPLPLVLLQRFFLRAQIGADLHQALLAALPLLV
jgi:hypothetical protein